MRRKRGQPYQMAEGPNGKAKLTTVQIWEIRRLYDAGQMNEADIADRFSVSQTTVSNVGRRKSWMCVPEEEAA